MKLTQAIVLSRLVADASTGEWSELYGPIQPMPSPYPPGVTKPMRYIKDRDNQTGWKQNSSPQDKRIARQDLVEVVKKLRRQIGKPEVSHTAVYNQSLFNPF